MYELQVLNATSIIILFVNYSLNSKQKKSMDKQKKSYKEQIYKIYCKTLKILWVKKYADLF